MNVKSVGKRKYYHMGETAKRNPFMNPEIECKVAALLLKMTLVEKVGQMTQRGRLEENEKEMIRDGKIGSLLNCRGAKKVNEFKRSQWKNPGWFEATHREVFEKCAVGSVLTVEYGTEVLLGRSVF